MDFVTKKIVHGLHSVSIGDSEVLLLGNLDSYRDWGHAKDYVRAMWLMLQQPNPDDFVIGSGETHSIREFVDLAGKHLGMDIYWSGAGYEEVGIDRVTGRVVIRVDPSLFRPAETTTLLADPSKARRALGWEPEFTFSDLVADMVAFQVKQ
jgi:GDPmannose 4,6-dehydratase